MPAEGGWCNYPRGDRRHSDFEKSELTPEASTVVGHWNLVTGKEATQVSGKSLLTLANGIKLRLKVLQ